VIRPENDNGRGIHWHAGLYQAIPFDNGNERARWQAVLDQLKIRYVKVLDDGGDSSLGLCEWLWKDRGILPIVRLYRHQPEPGSIGSREVDTARRYVQTLGIPVPFETKNEPDLAVEWNGPKPSRWWESVIQTSGEDARKILDVGGLWLFPAFTHGGTLTVPGGGDVPQHYNNMIAMFAQVHGVELAKEIGVAIHNYLRNHPLDYPYDLVNQEGRPLTQQEYDRAGAYAWDYQPIELINQWRAEDKNPGATVFEDWTCFNAWMVWDAWAKEVTGGTLPIYTTEGGANIAGRDDRRYPRTTPQMHLDATVAIEQWMMDEAPEQYITHCHWLIADAEMGHADGNHYSSWESQAWFTWFFSESDWQLKGQIPTVNAVKEMPSYPRKNCGGEMPQPPVEPPLVEPPTPQPSDTEWVNVPAVFRESDEVRVEQVPINLGELYWRVARVEYVRGDPPLIFFKLLYEDGTPVSNGLVEICNGGCHQSAMKGDDWGDYPTFGVIPSYRIKAAAGEPSDILHGLGLGIPETYKDGYKEHCHWLVTLQQTTHGETPTEPPVDPPPDAEVPGVENIINDLATHPTLRYESRDLSEIDTAVIHHTGIVGATPSGTAIWAVNTANPLKPAIMYTYWIEKDGKVKQCRPMSDVTWHAGEYK
jgi:hypothetical protein